MDDAQIITALQKERDWHKDMARKLLHQVNEMREQTSVLEKEQNQLRIALARTRDETIVAIETERNAAAQERNQLREELVDYDRLIDVQHQRMVIAERAWREAHPGNDLRLPDLGTLIQWLLDEREHLRTALARTRDETIVATETERNAAEQERDRLHEALERIYELAHGPDAAKAFNTIGDITEEVLQRERTGLIHE